MHMEGYERESASDHDIMNIWGYSTTSHMMAQSHSQASPGNETNDSYEVVVKFFMISSLYSEHFAVPPRSPVSTWN